MELADLQTTERGAVECRRVSPGRVWEPWDPEETSWGRGSAGEGEVPGAGAMSRDEQGIRGAKDHGTGGHRWKTAGGEVTS